MNEKRNSGGRPSGPRPRTLAALAALVAVGLGGLACSTQSRDLRYYHPSPAPGVVYVAEQVNGLEEWSRGGAARSYARVYTRAGASDEGQLLRITRDAVVLASARPNRQSLELTIDKRDVLFMRVWW